MSRSARYQSAKTKIAKGKTYSLEDAIALAKETSTVKFDSSVELHARLGIDPKKGEQQVRTTVVMPHGTGTVKRVIAFVSEKYEADAKKAGADIVGGEQLIDEIAQTKKMDFDVAVASPDMMAKIAKIAKILGPKGLMPNPKTDTVGIDVFTMVSQLKKGKTSFKNDNTANVHVVIGKVSQDNSALLDNANALLETLKRSKPSSSKGIFLRAVFLSTTMGPSIPVTL